MSSWWLSSKYLDSGVESRNPLTPLGRVKGIKNVASFLENTCLAGVQLGGGNRVISTEESEIGCILAE
jgi:hypothetical protein